MYKIVLISVLNDIKIKDANKNLKFQKICDTHSTARSSSNLEFV